MAKKKEDKILSIEEQIKKLQEEKKALQQKIFLDVGKTIFEKWEIESEEEALDLIEKLTTSAKELSTKNIKNEGSPVGS
ncbi:hypothetical protein [Gottfriedia solisilvae]|uniref:hypothetical protein n=1 Tax=Gottfriedia solisilvae TaxID=1516104 RepID=UPI003D2EA423